MKRVMSNRHGWIWCSLFVAFWAFTTITPINIVLMATNCFTMIVMAIVAFRYFPDALRAVRGREVSPDLQAVFYIKVGIVLSYGSSFFGRLYNTIWVQSDRNPVDAANDVTAFVQMCIGVGGIYLLCSPGAMGQTSQKRRNLILYILLVTAALTIAISYINPNTTQLMDFLRPWTRH